MKKTLFLGLIAVSFIAGCGDMGFDFDIGDIWSWDVSPPDPPELQSPRNGAILANGAITFNYNSYYGNLYHLQVATDKNFNKIVCDKDSLDAGTPSVEGLKRKTLYYWRVSASNAYGSSGWSEVWGFYII